MTTPTDAGPTCGATAPGSDPRDPLLCTEAAGHYNDPVNGGSFHGCDGPERSHYMWGDADDLPTLIGDWSGRE